MPPDWLGRMRFGGGLQTAVKIMSLQISRRQVLASGALPRRARHEVVRVQAHPSPIRAHCRVCWRHTACHGFNRSRNARLACSLALVPQSRRMYLTFIRPHLAGETKTNSNTLIAGTLLPALAVRIPAQHAHPARQSLRPQVDHVQWLGCVVAIHACSPILTITSPALTRTLK